MDTNIDRDVIGGVDSAPNAVRRTSPARGR
jgi:hypothetical protein